MPHFKVTKSILAGEIDSSPSKSHTLRAILFASLANGKSAISHYLPSPDTGAMIDACRQMGAKIDVQENQLVIEGVSGQPKLPENIINAGNSGQVLRFVLAIAALQPGYVVMTGDHSIRHNRPMQPLIDGLNQLGAFCVSTKNDGHAPIILKGPIKPGIAKISGEDSQPVSALLMATAFLNGRSEINVKNAGEKPWIDLTLSWLDKLGIRYENHNHARYVIFGGAKYNGFDYSVPGDFSSILFPVIASLITPSKTTIKHVDMNDTQGDKKVIAVLKSMGADIEYDIKAQTLKITGGKKLSGIDINANDFIDAVPLLAVIGCYSKGQTKITGAAIARKKECDRLSAIATELKKMGADIEELPDGLIIKESPLKGARVKTHHDHRMVMALTVAAMGAAGDTFVENIESMAKSYPDFYMDMKKLSASIEEIE